MAVKNQYSIVGRHMEGRGVTGYQVAIEGKGSRKLTREQVCFLVGRRQISNCEGQVYADKVILRGVGVNLDELPIIADKTGAVTNTANVGAVRKGTDAVSAVNQLMLVGQLVSGRNTVGYIVANAGGVKKKLSRDDVLKFAKAGRLGNARTQEYNGRTILRGVGINLNELPVTNVGQPKDPNESAAPVRPAVTNTPEETACDEDYRGVTMPEYVGYKPCSIPRTIPNDQNSVKDCITAINNRLRCFGMSRRHEGSDSGVTSQETAEETETLFSEVYALTHIRCEKIAGSLYDGLSYFNGIGEVSEAEVRSKVTDVMVANKVIRRTPQNERKIYEFMKSYYPRDGYSGLMKLLAILRDGRIKQCLGETIERDLADRNCSSLDCVSPKLCAVIIPFIIILAFGPKANLISAGAYGWADMVKSPGCI